MGLNQFHGVHWYEPRPCHRRVRHPIKGISRIPLTWPRHPRHRDRPRGDALPLAEALLAGGVKVLEVTLRTAAGAAAIETIARHLPEAVVGVGTVLNADDARRASRPVHVLPSALATPQTWAMPAGAWPAAAAGRGNVRRDHGALADGFSFLKLFPAGRLLVASLAQGLGQSVWAGELLPHGGISQTTAPTTWLCPMCAAWAARG